MLVLSVGFSGVADGVFAGSELLLGACGCSSVGGAAKSASNELAKVDSGCHKDTLSESGAELDGSSDDSDSLDGQILESNHGAGAILELSSLRVTRQLEMLNILVGFEQANRYALMDPQGNPAGFMVEEQTWSSIFGRQLYGMHRPFKILVMDLNGNPCLRISRPFSFINSWVSVENLENGQIIGESHQEWHIWRRCYNLFASQGSDMSQFARVDMPFLSWEFPMADEQGQTVAGVYRDFSGIGMELFTDYGLYGVCFDSASLRQRQAASGTLIPLADYDLDLDKRAVVLAAAVSIDFDYFSRHSHFGPGIMAYSLYSGAGA
ncbi:hypothetical protein IWW42_004455 [Coemansia sp. RSA 1085]|nr:hypothetical protein IWW42_004455 [Coemansia sp. RSA 1085]